jgi:phosphoethanolamine N-methyltransferase
MASPARCARALERVGFAEIRLTGGHGWYRGQARDELARPEGPERAAFEAQLGPDELARHIRTWRAMIVVVDAGEHCPDQLRARKQR